MKSLTRKCLGLTFFLLTVRCAAVLSLPCGDAEYDTDGQCCPKCPPGTSVSKDCLSSPNSTECEPCTEGTFMSEPTSRTQCYSCTTPACEGSGLKVKSSCTSTSDTVCEPQDGYFCVKFKESSCVAVQKHTRCEPGSYISRQGSASADTVCSRCSEGTFSDGTLTQCQPHTQCELINKVTVKAGTSDSDAECAEKNLNTVIWIGIGVGLVILLSAISAVIVIIKRKKRTLNGTAVHRMKQVLNPVMDQN